MDRSVFDAYVQREVPTGASAREALVAALALAAPSASERGEKVRLSSYGVTSGPFTSAAVPAQAPLPSPPPAPPSVRPATRSTRRPSLAQSTPPMPVQTAAPMPVSELETAPFPLPAPGSGPKLSLATKRTGMSRGETTAFNQAGATQASSPLVPLPGTDQEAPLAPLMPIPYGVPVPGGAFTPPPGASSPTQAPFPPMPGRTSTLPPVPGMMLPGGPTTTAHRPSTTAQSRRPGAAQTSSEWMVWLGRGAVVAVVLAIIGLGRFGRGDGEFWGTRVLRGVGILSSSPATPAEGTETTSPAPAVTPSAGSTSTKPAVAAPAPAPAVRPEPSAAFLDMVKGYKITGVVQGNPVRAIINGRLVQAGDSVDAAGNVRLIGLDTDGRRLVFEDASTARIALRY